uniref:Hillarin n=1 Tax=Hirudo medicinalis TaxID=6421 RepID=Q964C7_HIRME|nr:hillarin [Hirudo medicinalis]
MTSLADFKLEVVKAGQHIPPEPPKVTKSDIYDDIAVFSSVDEHAIEESNRNHPTFRDLVWNLCFKHDFSELERARAIFRWLTCKDLHKIKFLEVKQNSPELLLSLFKEGKATYARIFECIARHAGLSCVTILGWAKGVDYHPGIPLTSQPVNHSWNAIHLDGNWHLVDCHWATRFLRSEHNSPENLIYEYDDFYFITEPDQLCLTHYPEDPVWLLLKAPILTKEKFEEYPLLKSYFFTSGMHLLNDCSLGVAHAKYGIAVISVGFSEPTAYTFKLVHGDKMQETLDGVPLTSYVLQQTLDKQVAYHLRLPQKGDYYLIVFADVLPEAPTETGEHVFKAVCEFKIVCDQPVKGNAIFPQCSDIVWGPDDATAHRFELTPHTKNGIVEVPNGHIELVFDKKADIRVYPRLVKEGISAADLKKGLSVKNEDKTVTIVADLPQEGEYGLEIFANDPSKHGDMFTHISQYLVAYPGKAIQETYGKVPSEKIYEERPIIKRIKVDTTHRYKPRQFVIKRVPDSDRKQDIYSAEYPIADGMKKTSSSVVTLESVLPEKEYQSVVSGDTFTKEITVKPPADFHVQIQDPDVAPKPEGKNISVQKLFIDPRKVFKDLDNHAVQVSGTQHETVKDIIWHLIFARGITNELDKARAIFLWLCSKDLSKLTFVNVEKGSPEEMLMKLKSGDTTYARVYETLCTYAGLHCKTLTGFAKGAEYKPGMKFAPGQKGQHSWNAVFVNGTWQLVDCHWASRRLVGDKSSADNIRFELDEYYFMPAPSQLIFSHFPDEPNWQLLNRQLTQAEFEHLVPCKPAFFKYGLQLYSHVDAIIDCNDRVTIRLDCPPNKTKSMRFTFNLKYEDGNEKFGNVPLNQFAMLEVAGNACYITIRPPEKASYLLVIYAKDLDLQSKEGVYGGICEYKIVSNTSSSPNPFPPCVHSSWGPGDSADKFDLIPQQTGSIIQTVKGVAEIKFKLGAKLRFMAKLKNTKDDDKTLSHYVLHRVIGDEAIFVVSPPYAGEFGLEIYANDPETGGQSLLHAYQYLLICKDPASPVQPFPVLPAGYLGTQSNFDKIGLRTISHEDPYLETNSGEVQISFATSQPLRTSAQLLFVSNDQNKDCSAYVLQQGSASGITFLVKLTEPGFYKFQLFANPESEPGDSLVGVYNYLINCRSTVASLVPYPKQYGPWKEGSYLYEPLEGHLQHNRSDKGSASTFNHVYFKLEIPKAIAVVVVVGEEWTQLEQKQGGVWEGEVDLEKLWENERKLMVCANLDPNDDTSYGTYLEYSM